MPADALRAGLCALPLLCACAAVERNGQAESRVGFEKLQLSTEFTCEGATFGDFDGDGQQDVAAGPYWYAGPDFRQRHELYAPEALDPRGYSDNFFAWPRDFDRDGWLDLLIVGFPGRKAWWLRNPGALAAHADQHWERVEVFEGVDNESPAFTDLTGDGEPELVFHCGGRFGWAGPAARDPRAAWSFHPLSRDLGLSAYTHGLGVGDLDGDGRQDVLWKEGWFQQPGTLVGDPLWVFHAFRFSEREGGAQMAVLDVDRDGDADVITSLAAHNFGLSWFEQREAGGERTFLEHRLMDATPGDSPHQVCFGELHALALADIDGDGAQDIVTGKRWWSHGDQGDPEHGGRAVVYWFRWTRGPTGIDFEPRLADDDSGVGTQLSVGDLNLDGRPDLVIGNKRGVCVLLQRSWSAAERAARGAREPSLDFESGDLGGWTSTGNAFALQPVRKDTVRARGREPSLHQGEFWIGGYERVGDAEVGTLCSTPIAVRGPWASFLVGGGGSEATRVQVEDAADGRVLFKTSGANFESLQRVAVDLRAQQGGAIRLRLIDEARGDWGHLNFDDFRFHDEQPMLERAPGVPPILPLDPVQHAGLAPEQAARAMQVPPGFAVDLLAAEPQLHQPIALAIDDRGRLWVAEAFTYPKRQEGDRGLDDLVVFEDQDHDGSFETRSVFLEGLNLVSGLEVGFGGVWIGAAPYLLFVPDRDADLVPDAEAQVLLDGWGYQDTHETLNSFSWGPDGWLYGCHGIFTNSKVGKPGTPEAERIPLNAGVWRYHPLRQEFEVFAWGTSNPWGLDFDARGQALLTACVIPHLYHAIQGARYERQAGQHFDAFAFDDIKTIADHRHYLGENPHAGNLRSDSAGGGHAHCGAMLYLGDSFPEQYRGGLFFDNIHGNRINHDLLERQGSGFVGHHAPDFLLANDQWFRCVSLDYGPAGEVYAIDWYDKQACHLTTPEIWDRTNGRLYRVSYGGETGAEVDLASESSAQLVARLDQPNAWYGRHAQRLLQERGRNPALEQQLCAQLADPSSEARSLHALWALHSMGALTEELGRALLSSPHEAVRAWSIQLLLEDRALEPATQVALEALAHSDPSPMVRLYLASALQRLPLEARWTIVQELVGHAEDAADHNLPLLLWYGLEPLVAADPDRALGLLEFAKIDLIRRFLVRRAAAEPRLHAALVRALGDPRWFSSLGMLLEETALALEDQRNLKTPEGWVQLYPTFDLASDSRVHEFAAAVALSFGDPSRFPELRATLADPKASVPERSDALEALMRAKDAAVLPILPTLFDEPALRGPALRALAVFDDPPSAELVLQRFESFDAEARRDALNTLASRASYAALLLDALEQGRIARTEVGAFVARTIESLGQTQLSARLGEVWGRVRETSEAKAERVAALKALLTPERLAQADLPHGRELFSRTCQQCHSLFASGGKVGPDLTGSNRAELDYLLSNITDPNAVVGKDYLATLVSTVDGRIVTGIQRSETESSITLQTENEMLVLARDEIEFQRLSDLSTMPEGLLETLQPEELCDLVAYLQSPAQVPLRATRANLGRLFDGSSLEGWSGDRRLWSVEGGEIVGRTGGLEHNAFLLSELELTDFRLVLEVKLLDERGNSGIQLRSRPLEDGEVQGLQADIGPGWWGKLYEERGRGLLWPASGEAHVRPGEWNRYAIEASGQRVRTWINGQLCVDLEDAQGARAGQLALQLHSGEATEVRFRNLQLELLP